MNKYLCIIQARVRSTRLPNKVLMRVDGLTMLEYVLKRVRQSKKINKIIVATGESKFNDGIAKICQKTRIGCFRGPENDVLDRYYKCAIENPKYNYIIRLTADNPLIDPVVIDAVIGLVEKHPEFDYASNDIIKTFPYGLCIEIFKRKVLVEAAEKAELASEREHVTLYIKNKKKFKKGNLKSQYDFSHFRFTVDRKEDFEVFKFIARNSLITADYMEYISLLTKNPKVLLKNIAIARDEGLKISLKNDLKIR